MCTPFDKWKNVFQKEGGAIAIAGLKEVFNDKEDNNILLLQLDLTNATGVEKEALERRIALETELHKARTAVLPSLTDKQGKDAPKKREEIKKALKTLEEFRDNQQGEANLLEKDERKEDIGDIEKDVKKEEDTIKAKVKELESIAKEIKALDDEIQEKRIELIKREIQYEDTSKIVEDNDKKKKARQKKYDEDFKQNRDDISLGGFNTKIDTLKNKKQCKEALEKKVKQSEVIIKYVNDNLSYIAAKLAIISPIPDPVVPAAPNNPSPGTPDNNPSDD